MDVVAQIGALVDSLASAPRVFGRWGHLGDAGVEVEMHALVLAAQQEWGTRGRSPFGRARIAG